MLWEQKLDAEKKKATNQVQGVLIDHVVSQMGPKEATIVSYITTATTPVPN